MFIGFLPLLVVRQRELFRRALEAISVVPGGYPREAIAESYRRRAPFRALYAVGIFGVMVSVFWVGSKL